MTTYDSREIHIQRASPGTLDGEVAEVGRFRLPVHGLVIQDRVTSMFGNGCPTPWIEVTPKTVEVVLVGSRRYVVQAEDRIIVHHDQITDYLKPIPCPHCGR